MNLVNEQGIFPSKATPARPSPPKAIVIHYSYTHSPVSTTSVLNKKGLSTHFEVDQEGVVHQYVDPATKYTFHGGKFNSHTIGIDVTSTGAFSKPQIDATRELVTVLCKKFNIPQKAAPDGVKFQTLAQIQQGGYGLLRHRNIRDTLCPGKFPMNALEKGPGIFDSVGGGGTVALAVGVGVAAGLGYWWLKSRPVV